MGKAVCCYCDEEKNRSELKYHYALQGYVCLECRGDMKARYGDKAYSWKEDVDELDEMS